MTVSDMESSKILAINSLSLKFDFVKIEKNLRIL